jgi:hypothetical protein
MWGGRFTRFVLSQLPGFDVAKSRLSWAVRPESMAAGLPRIMPWRASIRPETLREIRPHDDVHHP